MSDPYSRQVRALFHAPAHAGRVAGGVEARVDDQGVRIALTMRAKDGRIDEIRFQAWGCPHLLAACEAFCAAAEGNAVDELRDYGAATLMQGLAIPVEKTGRILVLEDAARSLWVESAQTNQISS